MAGRRSGESFAVATLATVANGDGTWSITWTGGTAPFIIHGSPNSDMSGSSIIPDEDGDNTNGGATVTPNPGDNYYTVEDSDGMTSITIGPLVGETSLALTPYYFTYFDWGSDQRLETWDMANGVMTYASTSLPALTISNGGVYMTEYAVSGDSLYIHAARAITGTDSDGLWKVSLVDGSLEQTILTKAEYSDPNNRLLSYGLGMELAADGSIWLPTSYYVGGETPTSRFSISRFSVTPAWNATPLDTVYMNTAMQFPMDIAIDPVTNDIIVITRHAWLSQLTIQRFDAITFASKWETFQTGVNYNSYTDMEISPDGSTIAWSTVGNTYLADMATGTITNKIPVGGYELEWKDNTSLIIGSCSLIREVKTDGTILVNSTFNGTPPSSARNAAILFWQHP